MTISEKVPTSGSEILTPKKSALIRQEHKEHCSAYFAAYNSVTNSANKGFVNYDNMSKN